MCLLFLHQGSELVLYLSTLLARGCFEALCSLKHVCPATSCWQRVVMWSTALFTLSCQRCLTWYHFPSHHCLVDRAPSPLSSVCTLPSTGDAAQVAPVVHHVDAPFVPARKSDLRLVEVALDVLISDLLKPRLTSSSRPCKRRASRVLYLHTAACPRWWCLIFRQQTVPTALVGALCCCSGLCFR